MSFEMLFYIWLFCFLGMPLISWVYGQFRSVQYLELEKSVYKGDKIDPVNMLNVQAMEVRDEVWYSIFWFLAGFAVINLGWIIMFTHLKSLRRQGRQLVEDRMQYIYLTQDHKDGSCSTSCYYCLGEWAE